MTVKQYIFFSTSMFLYSAHAVAMNYEETSFQGRSLNDVETIIQRQLPGPVLLELSTQQGLVRFATWNNNGKLVSQDIARIISFQSNCLAKACLDQNSWNKDPFLKYVFRSRTIDNYPFLVVIVNRKGMYLADHFLQNR